MLATPVKPFLCLTGMVKYKALRDLFGSWSTYSKVFLYQGPDSGYFFEIFIAVQKDCPVLHCDLGDAAIYRAVDGNALSS